MSFITTPHLPTNAPLSEQDDSVAGKFTYESPMFEGVSFAISYTPDDNIHGSVDNFQGTTKLGSGWKDIVEGGLMYEGKFDDVSLKASFVGQVGDHKAENTGAAVQSDLEAWEVGANVNYMGLTFGGSYANWGKSGLDVQSANTNKKDSEYWTVGAGYDYGMGNVSATYFNSKKGYSASASAAEKRNTLKLFSLGVDYKLAPGFMPYAEYSNFKFEDYNNGTTKIDSNKGHVYMVGTKLAF